MDVLAEMGLMPVESYFRIDRIVSLSPALVPGDYMVMQELGKKPHREYVAGVISARALAPYLFPDAAPCQSEPLALDTMLDYLTEKGL
jgi:hypothetical protein